MQYAVPGFPLHLIEQSNVGMSMQVQWDGLFVRLLDPRTGQLLREHLRQKRGAHRIRDEDRPRRTPLHLQQLLARAYWPPPPSSADARTDFLSARSEAGKVILPKPSDTPSSCKATACSIGKRTRCWKIWPTLPWTARAKSTWNCCPPCPC